MMIGLETRMIQPLQVHIEFILAVLQFRGVLRSNEQLHNSLQK